MSLFRTINFLAVCIVFVNSIHAQNTEAIPRPNILFIMTDDHAVKAISAYDGQLNTTPNIDRIANEGVKINTGFVTNSICAPSRAVMLTGKHSHINGKTNNIYPFNWDQDNVAKQLQKGGYETALIGKIHLKGKPQGFDYYNVLPGQGHYYNPDFIENGKKVQYPGYVTQITTDLTLDWLKNKRNPEKPFLLLCHQKAAHRTWMPEPKHFKTFANKNFPMPETFYDDFEGRPAAKTHKMGIVNDMDWVYDLKLLDDEDEIPSRYRNGAKRNTGRMTAAQRAVWDNHYDPIIKSFKTQQLSDAALNQWKYNRYLQDYLATVQSVDDSVGEILDYLEANNLDKNTIVIYTSDQGFYLGEHGWFDKRFMYEESLRTPMLIKYPKEIPAGSACNALIQNLDFAPSFLDYAGIKIPEDIQGLSFRAVLSQNSKSWRDAIFYSYYEHPSEHHVNRHFGIRTNRYKLIHFYYDQEYWELYDLKKDPHELENLYNHNKYKKIQANLHHQLNVLRSDYKDSDALNTAMIKNFNNYKANKKKNKKS